MQSQHRIHFIPKSSFLPKISDGSPPPPSLHSTKKLNGISLPTSKNESKKPPPKSAFPKSFSRTSLCKSCRFSSRHRPKPISTRSSTSRSTSSQKNRTSKSNSSKPSMNRSAFFEISPMPTRSNFSKN